METLYLVKPSLAWKKEILAYKQAFTGEHLHGGSHLQQMDNFEEWLEHVENEASPATCRPNRAPSSTFICIREQDKKWWAFAISAIISIRNFWSISPVTSAILHSSE
jgi:predicted acetyltransferase